MFEIQTNDHHYFAKSIFLGALILVLGVTIWTNTFAQQTIDAVSTPKLIESIDLGVADQDSQENVLEHDVELVTTVTGTDTKSDINNNIDAKEHSSSEEVSAPYTASVVASSTSDTSQGNNSSEVALVYARKIEALIAVKGQETRINMLIIMQRFLANYPVDHPLYDTISRMVDIIKLGEVANKIEYCTQFDDQYKLTLFGMSFVVHSTIKYSPSLQKCELTYQYPDSSIHTCRLDESQKILMARVTRNKQGLAQADDAITLESVIEQYLKQNICFESKKAIITTDFTGSISTGITSTGVVVTSRWKRRAK